MTMLPALTGVADIYSDVAAIPRTSSSSSSTKAPTRADLHAVVSSWTPQVLEVLEKLRVNSARLSEYHRRRFYHFKGFSKYFDLPILVLSATSASFSVGMQNYMPQRTISMVTCFLGLLVSIITSVKLYLNINDAMANELKMSKEFYTLTIDVFKMVSLPAAQRGMHGVDYLNRQFNTYIKLVEGSNLLSKRFTNDMFVPRMDFARANVPEQTKKSSRYTVKVELPSQFKNSPKHGLTDIEEGKSDDDDSSMTFMENPGHERAMTPIVGDDKFPSSRNFSLQARSMTMKNVFEDLGGVSRSKFLHSETSTNDDSASPQDSATNSEEDDYPSLK